KTLDSQVRTSAFDMTMSVLENSGRLVCSFEYNVDLFDESTIERMGKHFDQLAETAPANAALRLIELKMLGEEERSQLLFEFNRSEREYECRSSIQELFARQARRLPDKVAMSDGDGQLSYDELNRAANRLASYLIHRGGVRPEMFVGLCM